MSVTLLDNSNYVNNYTWPRSIGQLFSFGSDTQINGFRFQGLAKNSALDSDTITFQLLQWPDLASPIFTTSKLASETLSDPIWLGYNYTCQAGVWYMIAVENTTADRNLSCWYGGPGDFVISADYRSTSGTIPNLTLLNYGQAWVTRIYGPDPAVTYYVSKDGDNANGGTSWGDSWLTIQHGVDNINSGDTLMVGPGYYNEQVSAPNFTSETIISGPDMSNHTIFDSSSVSILSILCSGNGNYTTWKNMEVIYLHRTRVGADHVTFDSILFAPTATINYDLTMTNIVYKKCIAYKCSYGTSNFTSISGRVEVYDCIAIQCAIGFTTGNSHHNCAWNCTTNFNGVPGTGSFVAAPYFVDHENADFRLLSSSPCLGAGSSNMGIYQGDGIGNVIFDSTAEIGVIPYSFYQPDIIITERNRSKKAPSNLGTNVGIGFGTFSTNFGKMILDEERE